MIWCYNMIIWRYFQYLLSEQTTSPCTHCMIEHASGISCSCPCHEEMWTVVCSINIDSILRKGIDIKSNESNFWFCLILFLKICSSFLTNVQYLLDLQYIQLRGLLNRSEQRPTTFIHLAVVRVLPSLVLTPKFQIDNYSQ